MALVSEHTTPRLGRRRLGGLDPLARYPRAGTVGGLALVAALIPILNAWHGANGPLGQSLPLFFLVPAAIASAVGGPGAGALVSCAAVAAWDWFFIPPFHRMTIASARDLLALVVFLAVAFLIGYLSTIAQRQTQDAVRRTRSTEALYDLSMALIAHQDLDRMLPELTKRLRETFDLAACAVLLPTPDGMGGHTVGIAGRLPTDLRIEENRSLAATVSQVLARGKGSVLGHVRREPGRSDRMVRPRPGEERARLLPLRVGTRAVGVLELVPHPGRPLDPELEHLLTTFANGATIA
ncbi:MAG: DUF4118 domain-containing protein, partial [Chloroflexota bacterium]